MNNAILLKIERKVQKSIIFPSKNKKNVKLKNFPFICLTKAVLHDKIFKLSFKGVVRPADNRITLLYNNRVAKTDFFKLRKGSL